ncbi:alpha/beta-hydrolase [Phaeosphaeriaceae sp. SRC1lsM3a]|nr:alpha/beta-hydrolase [Stagonospora sp. SRC1lsM3a]
MTKPQLVFVSGAWHVPAHFAPLESKLSALGYTCHIKQMPSVGSSNPPKDLSEDIAFIRSAVEKAIGPDGNDVVVLCHSWGGVVTGSALSRLSKKVREEGGQKGGVVRTGYMTAFMIPEGVSITDAIGGKKATWYDEEDPYAYAREPNVFYNDLSPTEQKHWFSLIQSHAVATFYSKTSAASWLEIPTSYLLCEDDLAIPILGQEAMTDKVKELGGDIEVTRVKSGHSPFLSKVEETAAWVEGVVRKAGLS